MRAERLTFHAGLRWMSEGFALFRLRPGFLNFLWFSSWLGLGLVSLLPFIGQAVGSLVMPGLIAGFWQGCRSIERAEKSDLAVLFSAFKRDGVGMLRIGLIYLLVSTVVFAASLMLAGDTLSPLMSGKGLEGLDPVTARQLLLQLLITLQVALLVSAPTLVAAPLAAWYGLPPGKALFFALVGMLQNFAPLLLLYLGWLLIVLGLPWLMLSASPAALRPVLQLVFSFAIAFVVMPSALASFYRAIADIFRRDGPPTA